MKYGHLFWAIILIAVGCLILISNFGWIDFHWSTVWRLWPLILIFWGIAILPIRDLVKYALLIGVILFTIIFFNKLTEPKGWFRWHDYDSEWNFGDEWDKEGGDKGSSRKMESQTLTVPFDSLSPKAELILEAAAGDFKLEGLTTELVSFSKDGNVGNYSLTTEDVDGKKEVTIHLDKSEGPRKFTKNEVQIRLNQGPVWDLKLDIGAAAIAMDLKDYRIDTIDINAGASSIELTLGSKNPMTRVTFNAGASSLNIRVPKDAACEVKSESFLVSRDFEGFTKKGSGLYQSENYSSGKNKIYIDIQTAVSSITIERY
jgi:hypothetical protein